MNMMKMQLYVFTQIIDLIEADQVRCVLYAFYSFYGFIFEQARAKSAQSNLATSGAR